jgi:hypothetical protein
VRDEKLDGSLFVGAVHEIFTLMAAISLTAATASS